MSVLDTLDRPSWLPESVWPWPTGKLATPSGPIAVTDTATGGPTLLLIHVGLGSFLWRDLMRELTPGFRCVTLDAPGTGRSHRPDAARTTLTAAADAVTAVIEGLDLADLTLVIHDLGGPAGIAAAARAPERFTAITAVNTFAWRPAGALFRGMLAMTGSSPIRESDALTGWLPAAAATRLGAGRHWTRAERAAFRAGIGRQGRRSFHRYMADARHADDLFQVTEAALAGPLRDRPLLTIFGERNDPLKLQPRWKTLFPHAHQHVIPRGYHFPMCDAPHDVAGQIRTWHASHAS